MKHHNIPETLVNETIVVISREGLERTTTKAISLQANLNEAYIYRYFSSKDELFVQVFNVLDNELLATVKTHLGAMMLPDKDLESRCRMFFQGVWRFLLGNKEKCQAFIRYYYSPYFQKYSLEEHQARYRYLVEAFGNFFLPEANTWMLLNHAMSVMLDFAVKVFDGQVPDDEDTAEHVFRLVYYALTPYFNNAEEKESV